MSRVSQFLENLGASLNLPTKTTMGVTLAIEEVTSTIIQYAFPDNKSGEVRLQVNIVPDMLIFQIVDEGIAFDPTRELTAVTAASPELQVMQGLGHFLIYRTMDEVAYKYENGLNQLTLMKRIGTDFKSGSTLKTNICKVDEIIVLDIEGRLDTANARDFSNAIAPLLEEQQPNIIINCEQMSYISSSGLRSFLTLQKSVKKNNGTLTIEAMRPEIRHIFEMTGCVSIFNIR